MLISNPCDAKQPCGIASTISYIYIAQFKPGMGGLPKEVDTFYISSDGIFQRSLETTNDCILSLNIGHVVIGTEFIDRLFNLIKKQQYVDSVNLINPVNPNVVFDATPARTRILICKNNETAAFWEGETSAASKSINETIRLVKSTISRADPIAIQDSSRFLRIRQMNQSPSQLSRKSYIVPKSSESAPGSILSKAIMYPYRLIPILKKDDTPFAYRRQHDRPVSIVLEDVAYRVHFLKLTAK